MSTEPDRESRATAQLYKIVYRSHTTATSDAAREADVAGILSTSRAWNSSTDITGALLLSPTGYAQVLEGLPHAVKSLFGHIVCDPRHREVELLYGDFDAERDFGNWSMAVAGPPDVEDVELASTAYKRDIVLGARADDIRLILRWLLVDGPLRNSRR